MKKRKKLNAIKNRRARRIREKLRATSLKPRLSIFRSNRYIYAQIIDDASHETLVSASSLEIKGKNKIKKSDFAKEIGKLIAEKAKKIGIKTVGFERGRYRYHGRVKALAEGAREGGLLF